MQLSEEIRTLFDEHLRGEGTNAVGEVYLTNLVSQIAQLESENEALRENLKAEARKMAVKAIDALLTTEAKEK